MYRNTERNVKELNIVKDTYNSTLNGARPLVLKVGVK